jgi:hypothetical protein
MLSCSVDCHRIVGLELLLTLCTLVLLLLTDLDYNGFAIHLI